MTTLEALLVKRAETLEAELAESDLRLRELAAAIREQGPLVLGSRQQPRANPLLGAEREERRARAAAVRELEGVLRKLENEQLIAAANALTAWRAPQAPAA
ncbi:MAG: hypothetical protein M3P18_11035 [Actinomycetota bacterium]|nr:hypothetical protein [Actinomycetota bacterium]